MLNEFKDLVDCTKHKIHDFKNDHIALCAFLGIDISNGYSNTAVIDCLKKNIKEQLSSDNLSASIRHKDLINLEDTLVYDSILNSVDNTESLEVIKFIRGSCTLYKKIEERQSWEWAIIYAKYYVSIAGSWSYYDNLRSQHPQQVDTALAASKLRDMGCEIRLSNDYLEIVTGLDTVVNNVEQEIKHIGGLYVIKTIFNKLLNEGRYLPPIERYIISQQTDFNPANITPLVPYGYLLNLSLKSPFDNSESIRPSVLRQKWEYVVDTTRLISTVMELQHYSMWAMHSHQAETIVDFVRKTALFDSTMSFLQSKGDFEIRTLPLLFSWVDIVAFEEQFGFKLPELIQTLGSIVSLAKGECGPVVIYQSAVKKILRHISDDSLTGILSIISHKANEINVQYKSGSDFEQNNFHSRPLIKMTKTKFLLCDKTWCAPSYYEIVASLTRQINPNTDIQIGYALEKLVYSIFQLKKIHFYKGNYPDGECDMLIEGQKAIVLVEIKKKALTRKSKSGIDTSIFIDLAASLLDAQLQNGRTEILLRKNGFVELTDTDGTTHRIDLNGRDIERIALTHSDFGSFQDKSVINGFLLTLVNTGFAPIDQTNIDVVKAFDKLEKMRADWVKQYVTLAELDPGFTHFPFLNCWYLSLQQLMLILDFSQDNDSFVDRLRSTKHISYSSLNFYYEFWLANLRSQKA